MAYPSDYIKSSAYGKTFGQAITRVDSTLRETAVKLNPIFVAEALKGEARGYAALDNKDVLKHEAKGFVPTAKGDLLSGEAQGATPIAVGDELSSKAGRFGPSPVSNPLESQAGKFNATGGGADELKDQAGKFAAINPASSLESEAGRFNAINKTDALQDQAGRFNALNIGDSLKDQAGKSAALNVRDTLSNEAGRFNQTGVVGNLEDSAGRFNQGTTPEALKDQAGKYGPSGPVNSELESKAGRFNQGGAVNELEGQAGRFNQTGVVAELENQAGRFNPISIADGLKDQAGSFNQTGQVNALENQAGRFNSINTANVLEKEAVQVPLQPDKNILEKQAVQVPLLPDQNILEKQAALVPLLADKNALEGEAGKAVGDVRVPPTDQTGLIDRQSPGLHNSNNRYPTDPIGGHIELTKQAGRQVTQTFGKTALFVAEQAALHIFNPKGANIVNPFIITNAFPAEGLLGTAFDGQNEIIKQAQEPVGGDKVSRVTSALAGGTLGQEEGATFFNVTRIRTVSEAIDYGINALAGALGIKDNAGDTRPLSPKSADFEKRLSQNPLSPDSSLTWFGNSGITNPTDVYDATYIREKISGVRVGDLAKGFAPIHTGAVQEDDYLTDRMLLGNLERAFESNAPKDFRNRSYSYSQGLDLTVDPNALAYPANDPDEAPAVQGSGMVFPFYFESMNFFSKHTEKFITFQATFNGLQETYQPNWQAKTYFGRPTQVYTYESTSRSVGFDFVIWAPNRISLDLVKQRINWLARHCYPSYDKFGTTMIIKEAPVIRFTIGDLFRNTPAIIQNLRYDWNDRWELSKDLIMPQAVKVSIQLVILHDKFMQNTGRAGVGEGELSNVSSDFYEFIKPPRRGIGNPKDISDLVSGAVGDPYGSLTEGELGGVVTNILGGGLNQASTFLSSNLGSLGSIGAGNLGGSIGGLFG